MGVLRVPKRPRQSLLGKQADRQGSHDFDGRLPELDQLPLEVRVLVLLHQELSPQDGNLTRRHVRQHAREMYDAKTKMKTSNTI